MFKSIFEGLGHFFEFTFKLISGAGMSPNLLFMTVGAIAFGYWINQMVKDQRAGGR